MSGSRPEKGSGLARRILIGLVRLYQVTLGATFGGRCRFHPSCSEYAIEALREHGAARGSALAIRRVVRCAPWSAGGIDLPPERTVNARG